MTGGPPATGANVHSKPATSVAQAPPIRTSRSVTVRLEVRHWVKNCWYQARTAALPLNTVSLGGMTTTSSAIRAKRESEASARRAVRSLLAALSTPDRNAAKSGVLGSAVWPEQATASHGTREGPWA